MSEPPPPSRLIAYLAPRLMNSWANWTRFIPIDQPGCLPSTVTKKTLHCVSGSVSAQPALIPIPVRGFRPKKYEGPASGPGATFFPLSTSIGCPPVPSRAPFHPTGFHVSVTLSPTLSCLILPALVEDARDSTSATFPC